MDNTKINQLNFKLIDALAAGEDWAEDADINNPIHVVEIYIDGVEIVEIFRRVELPYCEQEGHPDMAGSYGHESAKQLFRDLINAPKESSLTYEMGVYPVCCRSCGMSCCWAVTFHIREDENFVWWYQFEHEHRDWEYNLEFKFTKTDYAAAMEKLLLWKDQK